MKLEIPFELVFQLKSTKGSYGAKNSNMKGKRLNNMFHCEKVVFLCSLVLLTVQSQSMLPTYQQQCQWNSVPLANSPGRACKKPIGYNTDPTQATSPATGTNLELAPTSIGMRVNVGENPSQIMYVAYPTNGYLKLAESNKNDFAIDDTTSSATINGSMW